MTQPAPIPNANPAVWDLVTADAAAELGADGCAARLVEDMRGRDALGLERYGTRLQAHNGRDALVDAYEEQLDACAYLRQALEEGAPGARLYRDALRLAYRMRAAISRRSA